MTRLPRDPPQEFLDDPQGYVARHIGDPRGYGRRYGGKYRGFAEGVKGHRPERWQDAVALVKSGQATVAEAAHLIGVSRQRVHRWVYGDAWSKPDFRASYLKQLWVSRLK